MRVVRLSDGTSWVVRLHDEPDVGSNATERIGWEAVVFDPSPAGLAQRLVYRPSGWLMTATAADLAAALDEAVAVRLRWGGE
jgi:hypothetical protein